MRIMIVTLVVAALCVAPSAMASINTGDTVKLTDGPGANPGGSFFVSDQTAPLAPVYQTFCLERNEAFAFNVPYYVTIEDKAIYGGVGVADIGGAGSAGTLGVEDPLSPLSAWLYAKAVAGSLSGYVAGGDTENTALQDAIWYIENEIGSLVSGSLAESFYDAAVAAAPTDIGLVRVLNLWTSAADAYTKDGKVQSMLVIVPEASTIAVWSILGLVGFGAYKKRSATLS